MTDTEILTKAIEKAKSNGWNKDPKVFCAAGISWEDHITSKGYYWYIFSNDFAKAFFGTNIICWGCKKTYIESDYFGSKHTKSCDNPIASNFEWEQGLSSMVTQEDPIQYLKTSMDIPFNSIYPLK